MKSERKAWIYPETVSITCSVEPPRQDRLNDLGYGSALNNYRINDVFKSQSIRPTQLLTVKSVSRRRVVLH